MNLKSQAMKLLGGEEYEIVADLLNSQLERMETVAELLGSEEEVSRFNPEKLEEAVETSNIEEVLDTVLRQFNQRMLKLQVSALQESEVEDQKIREEVLE